MTTTTRSHLADDTARLNAADATRVHAESHRTLAELLAAAERHIAEAGWNVPDVSVLTAAQLVNLLPVPFPEGLSTP